MNVLGFRDRALLRALLRRLARHGPGPFWIDPSSWGDSRAVAGSRRRRRELARLLRTEEARLLRAAAELLLEQAGVRERTAPEGPPPTERAWRRSAEGLRRLATLEGRAVEGEILRLLALPCARWGPATLLVHTAAHRSGELGAWLDLVRALIGDGEVEVALSLAERLLRRDLPPRARARSLEVAAAAAEAVGDDGRALDWMERAAVLGRPSVLPALRSLAVARDDARRIALADDIAADLPAAQRGGPQFRFAVRCARRREAFRPESRPQGEDSRGVRWRCDPRSPFAPFAL